MKRQTVKKLIQCVAIIAAGVLAIILFMLAIWCRGKNSEYATKERCLEVLDEIQKACVSYLFTAGGAAVIRGGMDVQPFAAVIPRLYEMPEK